MPRHFMKCRISPDAYDILVYSDEYLSDPQPSSARHHALTDPPLNCFFTSAGAPSLCVLSRVTVWERLLMSAIRTSSETLREGPRCQGGRDRGVGVAGAEVSGWEAPR